tara:strand:+ start:554 stop:970 length:417 start_codon:yes stop_codon:yes gene_type:complete
MTLKELQGMIKEEFDALTNEADDVDVSVSDADVDATEGDDSEDMLRNIYDMLKGKFEAEEGGEDMGDMGEEMMDEVKDSEDKNEAADMEEASAMGFGDAGNKKTSGANAGYTPAKTTKGDGKLHEGVKRFQKLANIIK